MPGRFGFILQGEVGAVVRAAALLARQGAARNQTGNGEDIAGFVGLARRMRGLRQGEFRQALDRLGKVLAVANDGDLVPQNRARFLDRLLGIGGRRCGRQSRCAVGSFRRGDSAGETGKGAGVCLFSMAAADRAPKTNPSSRELLAKRLAPWTPVEATSPAAKSPGSEVAPCRSVATPPMA